MKALSLTQPWASLVACGAKRIETRSFRTSHSGPLAIHASKGFPKDARGFSDEAIVMDALGMPFFGWSECGRERLNPLPLGCVVATCNLVKCVRTDFVYGMALRKIYEGQSYEWEITEQELAFGNYEPGRWAWLLADIKPLATPVPAKGALGLWNWERP